MKPKTALYLDKQASSTITHVPTNRLAACFVNTLDIGDIRYDITFYGPFLKDLPRRLGHSAALDAAVKVLAASYPYFYGRVVPRDVLIKYGKALRTLREALNDPAEIRSPDTLCAIYLISICQVSILRWSVRSLSMLTPVLSGLASEARKARSEPWASDGLFTQDYRCAQMGHWF
jgi:hypothetical protein